MRADPRWDFNPDLDAGGYVLRKEVLGSRCNRLMVLHARLDLRQQLTRAEVEGGTLVPEGGGAPGPEPGG